MRRGDCPIRPGQPAGRVGVVRGGAGRAAGGRRAGRPRRGRRPARVRRSSSRSSAHDAAQAGRRAAARAARRAAARLPRGPRQRARLRGEGGRVHPDHRRAGPPVLGLPRLPPREAGARARARHGRRDDAHADGRGRIRSPASTRSSSTWTWTRSCRWCRTRSGRHDTFGLACTRRYYEDMGYPGHVNCTDNFNAEVDPYGIAPRAGWEAVNFFFNTRIEADNVLVSDEPWSRPGDYVMVRALTDLVCASSACPDDIDPANAWECTDIHVRVYSPENRFSGGHRPSRDPGGRASHDQGDGVPPADQRAHRELRRVPRLLAAALLQQRGRDRASTGRAARRPW